MCRRGGAVETGRIAWRFGVAQRSSNGGRINNSTFMYGGKNQEGHLGSE